MAIPSISNREKASIIVITGANTGLGLATVKALLRSSNKYVVLLGGRSLAKARNAAREAASETTSQSTVEPFQIDVEDDTSIVKAYEKIASSHSRIDCLINNAGASFDRCIQGGTMTTRQAWAKAWDVNVTGAHIVTSTFLPLLIKSPDPRLLFITSGLASLGESAVDNPRYPTPPAGLPKKPSAFMGYRSSKTGLNMLMLEWKRALKNDGVKVWSVMPGFLATALDGDAQRLKELGAMEPDVGGTFVLQVIEGQRDQYTGVVTREYKSPVQPW